MRPFGTAGPALEKARPRLLDKREKAASVGSVDRIERARCKARSGGQCEVVETWNNVRCKRRAVENHHLLGGIGRRNRGKSMLAEHRIEVCKAHHAEITGHVLVPNSDTVSSSLRFERKR